MGADIGAATGDHVVLLACESCGEDYETDETMLNDCPHCGSHYDWGVKNTDADAPWRDTDG